MTNIDHELRRYFKFLWGDVHPQAAQKDTLLATLSFQLKRKNGIRNKSHQFYKTFVYKS